MEVPDTDTEVDALERYPHIFLHAMLAEMQDWKQDEQLRQSYEQRWIEAAQLATKQWMAQRTGNMPAMRMQQNAT